MKILWFTNTPSNASLDFGYNFFGGGWISSLETLVSTNRNYELGICFFYGLEKFTKITKNNVVYYGIPLRKRNAVQRIIARHLSNLDDEDQTCFDEVIEDFKPELIHVFGTEMGYGKILMQKSEKVLFHLQGLIAPYADVYFPLGFSASQVLKISSINSILRGLTPVHDYWFLKKKAEREKKIIRYWKYFAGRTDWDKNYIKLLNPEAHYFHYEELLRQEFYENKWIAPSVISGNKEVVIGTTINPNLYKGLDLVYNAMKLIDDCYHIYWKIFGIGEQDALNKIVKRVLKPGRKSVNIKFYGQIPSQELIGQLKTCHFFIHPSYIDNSPNSVCEAMLLGMPVLSSSVGGIKSLIDDKVTGFLFNPYDKYDLAGLLIDLIYNYEKAKEAGSNARELALKRHSPDNIISEINKIYDYIYKDASVTH